MYASRRAKKKKRSPSSCAVARRTMDAAVTMNGGEQRSIRRMSKARRRFIILAMCGSLMGLITGGCSGRNNVIISFWGPSHDERLVYVLFSLSSQQLHQSSSPNPHLILSSVRVCRRLHLCRRRPQLLALLSRRDMARGTPPPRRPPPARARCFTRAPLRGWRGCSGDTHCSHDKDQNVRRPRRR